MDFWERCRNPLLSTYAYLSLPNKDNWELHQEIRVRFRASKTSLTIKAQITTAADDILKHIYFFNFSKKTSLDISCESSIHMKYQDLFSLKK